MTNKLDDAIEAAFDFSEHLNDPPDYEDLMYLSQRKILEAFVLDMPQGDLGEITLMVGYYIKKKDVAMLMTYSHSQADNLWLDLIDVLSCYRCAVHEYAKDAINGRIDDLFKDYCDSNGIFSDNYPDSPDELIGFREDDDGEEDRQQQADECFLLKKQAD